MVDCKNVWLQREILPVYVLDPPNRKHWFSLDDKGDFPPWPRWSRCRGGTSTKHSPSVTFEVVIWIILERTDKQPFLSFSYEDLLCDSGGRKGASLSAVAHEGTLVDRVQTGRAQTTYICHKQGLNWAGAVQSSAPGTEAHALLCHLEIFNKASIFTLFSVVTIQTIT